MLGVDSCATHVDSCGTHVDSCKTHVDSCGAGLSAQGWGFSAVAPPRATAENRDESNPSPTRRLDALDARLFALDALWCGTHVGLTLTHVGLMWAHAELGGVEARFFPRRGRFLVWMLVFCSGCSFVDARFLL